MTQTATLFFQRLSVILRELPEAPHVDTLPPMSAATRERAESWLLALAEKQPHEQLMFCLVQFGAARTALAFELPEEDAVHECIAGYAEFAQYLAGLAHLFTLAGAR